MQNIAVILEARTQSKRFIENSLNAYTFTAIKIFVIANLLPVAEQL